MKTVATENAEKRLAAIPSINGSTTPNESKPETGDMKELRRLFGIPRTTAYELMHAGEIKFISLRKRGNQFGRTLVDFDSVRAYLRRCGSVGGSLSQR